MKKHMTLRGLLAVGLLLALTGAVQGETVLSGLIGGDLTDPENNGTQDGLNYNAVFASSDEPGFGGGEFSFNSFDNRLGGGGEKWCCNNPAPDGHQLDAKILAGPHVLTHFTVASSNDSPTRDPRVWSIQGSNDGVNWTKIYDRNVTGSSLWGNSRNQVRRFDDGGADFDTPEAYQYFRYDVQTTGTNAHALGEIEYFGNPVPRIEVGGNNTIGLHEQQGTEQNVTLGAVENARYVRVVQRYNNETFQVAELQAFQSADGTGTNVALAGTATAKDSGAGSNPGRANDGNTDGWWSAGTTWHSSSGAGTWLQIELAADTDLQSVHFWGRKDTCCDERQNDFNLIIEDASHTELYNERHTGVGTSSGNNRLIPVGPIAGGEVHAVLDGGLTYVLELDGTMGQDQLTVFNPLPGIFTTHLDLNGATLEIELLPGSGPYITGDTFQLLVADQILGQFDDIILPQGLAFDMSNLYTTGKVTVIPEPMTMLAVGMGIAGLGGYIRKRRRV